MLVSVFLTITVVVGAGTIGDGMLIEDVGFVAQRFEMQSAPN
ncbi:MULTISPECIES: hypothetical protein [Acinetobacter]|nr:MULTISPECIES: hypothetical protein [Acinetobacter]